MMSYEQYIIDLEIWSYIKHFSQLPVVNQETLATEIICTNTSGLLTHDHTLKHMRNELHSPELASPESYEDWWASAGPDVVIQANEKVKKLLDDPVVPDLDENIDRELKKYVCARKKVLEQVG
jgi:trimethylamine:corrinoid methyltransferase-like protein